MLWLSTLEHLLIYYRDFGHPLLTYSFPFAALLSHLLGICLWFGISEARFDGSCDNDDIEAGDRLDLCATDGPILAIVQVIVQLIAALWFTLVYFRREIKIE
jgi:hypothetical protein